MQAFLIAAFAVIQIVLAGAPTESGPQSRSRVAMNMALPQRADVQIDSQPSLAPSFTLKNLKGGHVRLADYKGKVVLINLWATWCAPCRVEMPALVKLQKKYAAQGLQILGVTYPDEPRGGVNRIVKRFKLNYPVMFGTPALLDAYQIGEVLPVTVVVDRAGRIRDRILGILEPEEFNEKVAPLLNGDAHK